MKPPLFVRPVSEAERSALHAGSRSAEAFPLRRCQILLASDRGQRPAHIAAALGCSSQTVRDALHAFATDGLNCLHPKSKRPHTTHPVWPEDRDDALRGLLHQSPRTVGKPTSLWTLDLAAQVRVEKGWTTRRLSGEAIRQTLQRLGVGWKRAKHWLVSPDPEYARKENGGTS